MNRWRGLEEFMAVVESGSFSRAAEMLDLTPSQVSKRINELEARLDTRLLYRSTRVVTPSPQGQRYYQTCKAALSSIDNAEEDISAEHESISSHLKICCIGLTQPTILVTLLSSFLTQHPKIELKLLIADELPNLIEQSIDFAMITGEVDNSHYSITRLAWLDYVLAASPELLQRHGEPESPADLEHMPCIIQKNNIWHLSNGRDSKSIDVSGRWRSPNLAACVAACVCGLGIFTIPHYAMDEYTENGRLKRILPDWSIRKPISIAHPHDVNISAKTSLLVAFLEQMLTQGNGSSTDMLQTLVNRDSKRLKILTDVGEALRAEKLSGQFEQH